MYDYRKPGASASQIVGADDHVIGARALRKMLDATPAIEREIGVITHSNIENPGSVPAEQRLEFAYEMWRSGESFTDIAKVLQLSPLKVRQMIHRYSWALKHPK